MASLRSASLRTSWALSTKSLVARSRMVLTPNALCRASPPRLPRPRRASTGASGSSLMSRSPRIACRRTRVSGQLPWLDCLPGDPDGAPTRRKRRRAARRVSRSTSAGSQAAAIDAAQDECGPARKAVSPLRICSHRTLPETSDSTAMLDDDLWRRLMISFTVSVSKRADPWSCMTWARSRLPAEPESDDRRRKQVRGSYRLRARAGGWKAPERPTMNLSAVCVSWPRRWPV